jgi:hypothetical protein
MHMRPGRPFVFTGLLLASSATLSHFEKPVDRNGGHWDQSGNYHCHEAGCRQAPSRFEFARRTLTNRVEDLLYLQEDWPHWLLLSGCKTSRTVVLEETSRAPVTWTNPRQCELREGLWEDPYNGEEYTRAAQLEVDHIIPPVYANASNGYQWDDNTRAQFANDPLNLVPVSRDSHRKKRERGIADWQPREEFQCEYAQAWKDVAEKYDLDLYARDTSRINRILENCDTSASRSIEEE